MSRSEVLSATECPEKLASAECFQKVTAEETTSQHHGPAWLTKQYLQNCLRTYHQDAKLKITQMHSRPALAKGENYGGVLTRVRADFRTTSGGQRTGHYIVKTSYEADEFSRKLMEPYDIFSREMDIYQNVLPKLNALLQSIDDTEQIFAETMAVDHERSALIFEDLNVRDFVMPDRTQGLDMELTKIVLRKLAKMHATSAVLNERENHCLESYDRGMFNRHTSNYAPGFVGLLDACARMVSQWKGYEAYGAKLSALKPVYMELGKRVFDVTEGHISVLAHGDLWTNNVLVKYDEKSGKPLDVILIDFQYAAWGSPAVDLLFLLNTSLKEDMHLHQQDELIAYYYYVLADTLRKLTYRAAIPTLHGFHIQMEEKAFNALSSTCVFMPVHRNEETGDADFSALMKEDERAIRFKDTCFKNKHCRNIIRQLLPTFERRGLLETHQ